MFVYNFDCGAKFAEKIFAGTFFCGFHGKTTKIAKIRTCKNLGPHAHGI